MRSHRRTCLLASIALAGGWECQAPAQSAPRYRFDLPAQDLKIALRSVTREAGLQLGANGDDLRGRRSPEIHADTTVADALQQLLAGTDLHAEITDKAVFIRGRAVAAAASGDASASGIVVTGTRIRGARVASPAIRLSQQDILDAGQTNLGDAVRAIPQNFGGSLNPGANINTPDRTGSNIGSGSSIDLRGLGGDATLTLLDGHRLAYSGAYQAIDVSSIPVAALDRIEIVADGASAVYGSDAVAGVANIILKRDYEGVSVQARYGTSTDGGDEQQQYDLVGGSKWASGGFMLAYDFSHNTPLLARQRSYTADVTPGLTLLPRVVQHNIVLTGHQNLAPNVTFSIDSIYNHRRSDRAFALTDAGQPSIDGETIRYHSRSLSVAPSLTANFGRWTMKALGVASADDSFYRTDYVFAGAHILPFAGCYCNTVSSAELNADGPLFQMPAGPIKIALGTGIRSTNYHAYRTQGDAQSINETQRTYYLFGEVNLPVVSPDMQLPLVHRLDLNAAARFEDYPGVDRVVTPRLGLVYAPSKDLDLKASWGRSFKAPTFYERYSDQYADYDAATAYGGGDLPNGTNVLVVSGGNPELKPERATTWSFTASLHPTNIAGLQADISYFNVDYRDRIVAPIRSQRSALVDPLAAPYILYGPTAAAIAAAIGNRVFTNYTGLAYDPGTIGAIIDDTNINAARQRIHGADIALSYTLPVGSAGTLRFAGDASYLSSTQQVAAGAPPSALAGTFLNPPHVRGRAGLIWLDHALTLSTYLNYTGHSRDTRAAVGGRWSRAMTTADVTARYVTKPGPELNDGLELTFSMLNIFNRRPGLIASVAVYDLPYDPLNYSPVGRFISISVGKHW